MYEHGMPVAHALRGCNGGYIICWFDSCCCECVFFCLGCGKIVDVFNVMVDVGAGKTRLGKSDDYMKRKCD